MPAGVVEIPFFADFAQLIQQSDAAAVSIEAFAGKVVTSGRQASRAMADYAKAQGATADEAEAAAARTQAAWDSTYGAMSKGAKAAGNAALSASRLYGESADAQTAAFSRAATAQKAFEDRQKAAADAALASTAKLTTAAKMSSAEQVAAQKAVSDAQEDAAAKADLVTAKLTGVGGRAVGVAGEISKVGGVGFAASIAGMGDLAAKFQQSTEQIAANSDISSKAAAAIGKAFLTTSGSSIYSAKEMADAFAQVSGQLKATEGAALGAGQSLKVMKAAGDLAEATSSSLTSSTAALATVMQGYRLPVSQAASASDLLFNTSRALNAPLGTVSQSINRLHGRLGDLAPSLGDIGGLMVELGSHGVQGSRGVSVVNTAMQTLVGGSTQTNAVLQALGVNVFNSQGKFDGLQNVIAQLQPKMADLTQKNQDLAAKTLFGSSAAQVMLDIIKQGPAAFDKATVAAQKQGTAAQAAGDQNKTFGKQLDILKATVENAATSNGLDILPMLTGMTKGLESMVQWFEKGSAGARALEIAISSVLGVAVSAFAYHEAVKFVGAVSDMKSGITALAGKLSGLVASNAEAGASFGATATEAAAAGATLDTEWAAAAAGVEATNEAIQASNVATGASFAGVMSKLAGVAPVAGAALATALLLKGDSPMKTYPKHPPGLPQISPPSRGEREQAYIKATLGLPANYQGGALSARSYSKDSNVDLKTVDSFFKWLNEAGHFGRHGFAATAGGPLAGAGSINPSATTTTPQQFMAWMEHSVGLSKRAAAGITGNIGTRDSGWYGGQWEAGSPVGAASSGFGLAQWSTAAYHKGLADMAKKMGQSTSSIAVQEAYLKSTMSPSLIKKLNSSATPAGAAAIFEQQYRTEAASAARRATSGTIAAAFEAAMKRLNAKVAAATGGPAVLTPAAVNAAALTVQTTGITDQTTAASSEAQAHDQVVTDMQALASQKAQAAAQQLSDAASVVQAKFSAAAQQISDASKVSHDQAQIIVQGMTDATQVQTDKLAERGLYGDQLVAQKLTVQEDIMKEGFDRQTAIAQKAVDSITASWDGKIAAQSTRVAMVTQHQDQLEAKAQQRDTQVQLHADMRLANATAKQNTVQLASDMKVALAQQAVTLSAGASKKQQAAAQTALGLAQAQAGNATALAAQHFGSVSADANQAELTANGQYQQVSNHAAKVIAEVNKKLAHDQGAAQLAEAQANKKLTSDQDKASVALQRMADNIAKAQAGPYGPQKIVPRHPDLDASAAAVHQGHRKTGGLHIENMNISGLNKTTSEVAQDIYLKVRPKLTGAA